MCFSTVVKKTPLVKLKCIVDDLNKPVPINDLAKCIDRYFKTSADKIEHFRPFIDSLVLQICSHDCANVKDHEVSGATGDNEGYEPDKCYTFGPIYYITPLELIPVADVLS
jgi:hypothetical protein